MRMLHYEETFEVAECAPEDLHSLGEWVMAELLDLEGGQDMLTDSAVSTNLHEMSITVEMSAFVPEGRRSEDVAIALRSAARTAFHTLGGSTEEWESQGEVLEPQPV